MTMGKGGLKIKPKSLLGKRTKINKKQQPEDIKTKNANVKKHKIQYAPTTAQKQSVALKELDSEISYPEIVRFTDKALRSLLLAEGVLRAKKERAVIMCWSCGSRMEAANSRSTSLRCSGACLPDACQAEQRGRCFHAFRPDGSFWMRQGLRNLRQNRVALRHEGWQQQRRDPLQSEQLVRHMSNTHVCSSIAQYNPLPPVEEI